MEEERWVKVVEERRKLVRVVETPAGVVPSRSVVEIEGIEMEDADEEVDEERERWLGMFWGFRDADGPSCVAS